MLEERGVGKESGAVHLLSFGEVVIDSEEGEYHSRKTHKRIRKDPVCAMSKEMEVEVALVEPSPFPFIPLGVLHMLSCEAGAGGPKIDAPAGG